VGYILAHPVYGYLHFAWHGELQEFAKVAKNFLNTLRGFKVIKFVTSRKGVCDFLLVISAISRTVLAMATVFSFSVFCD